MKTREALISAALSKVKLVAENEKVRCMLEAEKKAGVTLMAENDQLKRLLEAEKRAGVTELMRPLEAMIPKSVEKVGDKLEAKIFGKVKEAVNSFEDKIPKAIEHIVDVKLACKLDLISDMISAIMTQEEQREEESSKDGKYCKEKKSRKVEHDISDSEEASGEDNEVVEVRSSEVEDLKAAEEEDKFDAEEEVCEEQAVSELPVGRSIRVVGPSNRRKRGKKSDFPKFDPSIPPPPLDQCQALDLSSSSAQEPPLLTSQVTPALTPSSARPSSVGATPSKAPRRPSKLDATTALTSTPVMTSPGVADVRSVSRLESPPRDPGLRDVNPKFVSGFKRRVSSYGHERREDSYEYKRREDSFEHKRWEGRYEDKRREGGYGIHGRQDGVGSRGWDDGLDNKRREDGYNCERREDGYDIKRREDGYDVRRREDGYDSKRRGEGSVYGKKDYGNRGQFRSRSRERRQEKDRSFHVGSREKETDGRSPARKKSC